MADLIDFHTFFQDAPASIDLDAIWYEWQSVQTRYRVDDRHLPSPVWVRRGLPDDGVKAWATLTDDLVQIDQAKPVCIYIHIPFCSRKCSFCDCYSFQISHNRERHFDQYLTLLEQELQTWSQQGTLGQRPVSTIHLGGGTPTFFSDLGLQRIVKNCRASFHTQADTEWALETTTSELTGGMFELLSNLGFSRLHVGIQSLNDRVRQLINRRETATAVLDKIARAVALDWVVSVDLIYGLPEQSLDSLLGDIRTLKEAGVEGFSLYELQSSPRNRKFIQQHNLTQGDPLKRYFLLQAASQQLAGLGYKKTLFNHSALGRDTNLYFTFPQRLEDCLAIGTIADGVFNDYHYRHTEYRDYCKSVTGSSLGLKGGIRRDTFENRLQPLEVALLSGTISRALFSDVLGQKCGEKVLNYWVDAGLVYEVGDGDLLMLTASGSWLVARMLAEAREYAAPPSG
jgi:coproporphyrinogen III oxidase-like Fe-S oxidoreductase